MHNSASTSGDLKHQSRTVVKPIFVTWHLVIISLVKQFGLMRKQQTATVKKQTDSGSVMVKQ